MKVNREDFKKVIGRVAPMVKGRTTIPIMGCVKLRTLNGGFHATACDGNSFVEASCNCKGELNPVCVAPGPLMALSSYGPDTLDLSVDKNRLRVKSGAIASLSTHDAEQFPSWPDNGTEIGVNVTDLADAIEAVAWAADDNPRSYAQTNRRCVWIDMNTKEHSMVALALDGRRAGLVIKSAVVPNARIIFYSENAKLLLEALREEAALVSASDARITAGGAWFKCSISQLEPFEMPVEQFKKMKAEAKFSGTIHKEPTLTELSTIQSLATYEENVYVKGELSGNGFRLDFVGKTNEFHSVVAPVQPETQSKSGDAFSFDAKLLHDVLKHTPGDNIPCLVGGGNTFFEGDGVLTALALVKDL